MLKNEKWKAKIKLLSLYQEKYSDFTIFVYNCFFVNFFLQKAAEM